ncbi:unnamed protein product, partial [Staurois parvus]
IHYIWSPTVHRTWKCNYFSKYKLLNTFSSAVYSSRVTSAEHWLKLVGVFHSFCCRRMQNP